MISIENTQIFATRLGQALGILIAFGLILVLGGCSKCCKEEEPNLRKTNCRSSDHSDDTEKIMELLIWRGISRETLDSCELVVQGTVGNVEICTSERRPLGSNWKVTLFNVSSIRGTFTRKTPCFWVHSPSQAFFLHNKVEDALGLKGTFYLRLVEGSTDIFELVLWVPGNGSATGKNEEAQNSGAKAGQPEFQPDD